LEARRRGPDGRLDRVIAGEFNKWLPRLDKGAVADDAHFYDLVLNAQNLVALADASDLYPDPKYASARDGLIDFFLEHAIRSSPDGPLAYSMRDKAGSLETDGEPRPGNQLWLAQAFDHVNGLKPGRIPSATIGGLMMAFVNRYWSNEQGAFVGDGGFPAFDSNAFAALFSFGPILQGVALDSAMVAYAVAAKPLHLYSLGDPAIIADEWNVRFSLSSDHSATVDLLLPGSDVGAFNLSRPGAEPSPPRLSRAIGAGTRVPIAATPMGTGAPVIRFSTEVGPTPATFRLEAFAPVRPVRSEFGATVALVLENTVTQAVTLRSLRLEIAATDIDVRSIKVGDVPLSPTTYEVVKSITTQEVPKEHTRLVLNGLTLGPGSSEVVIEYSDNKRPLILSHVISHDPSGQQILRPAATMTALQGDRLYVRAQVVDNAVLRQVLLRYQTGVESVDTPMQQTVDGVFMAQIQNTTSQGRIRMQVIAIDGAQNFNQSEPFFVEIQNPLLSGSRVLFASSVVFFLSAFVIWLKVRRKHGV
jgi:hypothetical protein